MNGNAARIEINVNLEISPNALETIVEMVKRQVGRNEKGYYQIDTAARVGELISRFLHEKEFDSYVLDPANYPEG